MTFFLEVNKFSIWVTSLLESSEDDPPTDVDSVCTDDFAVWICFFLDIDIPKSLAFVLVIFTLVLFMPENVGTGNYALVDFRVKFLLDGDLLFIDDLEAASCPELSNTLSLPCPRVWSMFNLTFRTQILVLLSSHLHQACIGLKSQHKNK